MQPGIHVWKKIFFQYRIFPLSFFFFFFFNILCCPDSYQNNQCLQHLGDQTDTGKIQQRVKIHENRKYGEESQRCQNKGRLGGQRGRRPGERLGVHQRTRVPRESAGNCRVTSALPHKRTAAFHLCFTQKTWPPSKPNNSSATNLPAQGHNHACPSLPPHRG